MAEELQSGEVCGGNWWLNSPRSFVFPGVYPYPENPGFVLSTNSRSSVSNQGLDQDLLSQRDVGGRSLEEFQPPIVVDSGKNSGGFDMYPTGFTPSPFEYASAYPSSSMFTDRDEFFGDLGMISSTPLPENHSQWGGSGDFPAGFVHSSQPQFFNSSTDCTQYPNQLNFSSQRPIEETPKNTSRSKRPRTETRSPTPVFKVRKEKLGGRVTALQQLVSPFGKTDTASVLHEAIDSIKFLHEQVNVLSTPYFKSKSPPHQVSNMERSNVKHQEGGIRSKGLCLVPVSRTYHVLAEMTSDFWTPAFAGSFK